MPTRTGTARQTLLVDVSNSFTKFALSRNGALGRVRRVPTRELGSDAFYGAVARMRFARVVLSSVVPSASRHVVAACGGRVLELDHRCALGVGIDYPAPSTIGADRLANAAACAALYGAPAVVVDFGTAVTFDVIDARRNYVGGVIAPGLDAMTGYLHDRTALLPKIRLSQPRRVVGKSTREAMLSGAVIGYRGLVAEIVRSVVEEAFDRAVAAVVATGGDAEIIASGQKLFSAVDPLLTLRGLAIIDGLNPD